MNIDEIDWSAKDIDLSYSGVTELPEGLHVEGDLNLECCRSLRQLPAGMNVGGTLNLSECTSLSELPAGLNVAGGDLWLNDCTSLRQLPEGLHVGEYLNLRGCTSLSELTEGLYVGEHLNLEDCTSLSQFPAGIRVGGNLYLRGCTSLGQLPECLKVGGFTYGTDRDIEDYPFDCALKEEPKDEIRFPNHYTYSEIHPEHVNDAWGLCWRMANVIKYICRHDKKGTKLKDLEKAREYLSQLIRKEEECSK